MLGRWLRGENHNSQQQQGPTTNNRHAQEQQAQQHNMSAVGGQNAGATASSSGSHFYSANQAHSVHIPNSAMSGDQLPPPSLQNMLHGDGEIEALDVGSEKVSLEDFEIIRVIGQGSFGKVFQVVHKKTAKVYAMKTLRKKRIIKKKKVQHTRTERRILEQVDHPYIVRLHYAFQTDSKLYMIMDYVNGGDMFFHLQKEVLFPEERTRFYAAEIVLALEHLHSLGIIYRDLKAENVLLDADGHVKLADFGLAKENVAEGEEAHTYCAPEILRRSGHGHSVDWWCVGVLMFEMLTGLHPFYSENDDECRYNILDREIVYPEHVSAAAKDLMAWLLQKNAALRPAAAEIRRHPFFSRVDWNAVASRRVPPLFVPTVLDGQFDAANFDEDLTARPPVDSPVEGGGPLVKFKDFSYVPPKGFFGRNKRAEKLVQNMIEAEAMMAEEEDDAMTPSNRVDGEGEPMKDAVFPMSL